ncbi:hypothetical protein AVEN_220779-1 [Araneus ventricosus]|uniref:Uncharacterized protein n=1 Tax=Araneus ventricosus TaxID=182803 RepID=A0A4Y2BGY8_ARAVE|nr:hypothetical protein AVEN_220779-1 [Araneus ventricosus]
MNSRRFPSPKKPLWKLCFITQTPSLTLARPKIQPARIKPTKPVGAGVVVRVLTFKERDSKIVGQTLWDARHTEQRKESNSGLYRRL